MLTAAHVVYDASRGGFATSLDVRFGNETFIPAIPGGNAKVLSAYTSNPLSLSAYDVSVVLLGTQVATIRPAAVVLKTLTSDLAGFATNVVGYPAVRADLFGYLYGAADTALIDPKQLQ